MTLFSLKDQRIQIILDETNGPYICILLCFIDLFYGWVGLLFYGCGWVTFLIGL